MLLDATLICLLHVHDEVKMLRLILCVQNGIKQFVLKKMQRDPAIDVRTDQKLMAKNVFMTGKS